MSGHRLASGSLRAVADRGRVLVVIGVVLVLTAVVGLSLMGSGPDSRLMLRATFADASPLLTGNDVRLAGVKVGTVASMRIVDGAAEVTVELDREALPVHDDARLTIRPVSLLGERYVELDRGSADRPVLADGARLGLRQTGSSVGLDEVLNTLDEPTSAGLANLIGTLGKGMDGNGGDVKRALAALAPALGDTRALTGTLRQQNDTLGRLVDAMSQVAQGLGADDGKQLDRLVAAAASITQRTATNEAAFRSVIRQLPATLAAALRTLRQLEGTANAAVPTLQALRPTTKDLKAISAELLDFADATDPALAAADPVLKKAQTLLDNAAPVAQLLQQQSPSILATAKALDPIATEVLGDFRSVMEFIRGWALATNGRDGLSHYFRAGLVLTEYSVTGLLPGGAPNPSTPAPPTPDTTGKNPTSGTRAGGAAGLGGAVGGVLDGVGGLLGGLLTPRTDNRGGVTGLSAQQESGALSFLLGGS